MQLSGCEEKRIAQSQELKRLLKEKSGKKCLTGKDEGAKLRKTFGRDSRRKTSSQFPVMMAKGYHLFPYRTQKLRPSAPMVLGWTRPGRVGRCRNPYKRSSCRNAGAFLLLLFCGFGGEFSENGCFDVAQRWMGGEEGEESAWGDGTAGKLAGGEGECFCAVARGKTIGNFLFKKDAFYRSKNTAGKVFLKKNH